MEDPDPASVASDGQNPFNTQIASLVIRLMLVISDNIVTFNS